MVNVVYQKKASGLKKREAISSLEGTTTWLINFSCIHDNRNTDKDHQVEGSKVAFCPNLNIKQLE